MRPLPHDAAGPPAEAPIRITLLAMLSTFDTM
jgi:hypothetical protein